MRRARVDRAAAVCDTPGRMNVPPSPPPALVCDVLASRRAQAATFAAIARALALDVGQPLAVRLRSPTRTVRPTAQPVLTLHLPAALAATQNQVWCLACRLACFCPAARVSVLISGEGVFAPAPPATTVRRIRSAATA